MFSDLIAWAQTRPNYRFFQVRPRQKNGMKFFNIEIGEHIPGKGGLYDFTDGDGHDLDEAAKNALDKFTEK